MTRDDLINHVHDLLANLPEWSGDQYRAETIVDSLNRHKIVDVTEHDRQEFNRRILKLLTEVVNKNPDLRFSQILSMYDLARDRHYEESEEMFMMLVIKHRNLNRLPPLPVDPEEER